MGTVLPDIFVSERTVPIGGFSAESAPRAADVALVVAALQKLREHKLLKERYGAGIKPDALGILRLSLIHI